MEDEEMAEKADHVVAELEGKLESSANPGG